MMSQIAGQVGSTDYLTSVIDGKGIAVRAPEATQVCHRAIFPHHGVKNRAVLTKRPANSLPLVVDP